MIIGLSGYAQAGKDTAGKILVEQHGFQRLAFADALKAVAYDSNPTYRKMVDTHGIERAKQAFPTVRQFLQDLGVACRQHLDPDVWVKALMRQVTDGDYVITDVRFPNEADAIRSYGPDGFLVRVDRPGVGPVNGHISETAIDGVEVDWAINNDGDLAYLARRVSDMLVFIGMKPVAHA